MVDEKNGTVQALRLPEIRRHWGKLNGINICNQQKGKAREQKITALSLESKGGGRSHTTNVRANKDRKDDYIQ
jgi:hypothetical protein